MTHIALRTESPAHLLGAPASRPEIAGTAYDTAWLAGVPASADRRSARFPSALQWLAEHQWPNGSWGGQVPYTPDRILCTLAALAPLAAFGRREADAAAVQRGTRYLWQHGHLLATEPVELVGFELLLPALIRRAQHAGIAVPPHLDVYGRKRDEKLRLISEAALYSPRVTVVHSLEFLGDDATMAGLRAARGANGAVGNSPAATAFYYTQSDDPQSLAYLQSCLARTGGAMAPVLYPCETFELLWSAYHLFLAGVPVEQLLSTDERVALATALRAGGVSLSPSFPIPDADDTAVALLLLHALGEDVDPGVLQAFALSADGCFASFPHERHSSVGVNLHVLQAILRVPGYPDRDRVVARLLDYLVAHQVGGLYWLDKWHISPYYATAHALCVLNDLPPEHAERMQPHMQRARAWLRHTQNGDGSWGFYNQPTAEETAYAILALAMAGGPSERWADRHQCMAGLRFLRQATHARADGAAGSWPPLWIDKCLYTPPLIVEAALRAAFTAVRGSGPLGGEVVARTVLGTGRE